MDGSLLLAIVYISFRSLTTRLFNRSSLNFHWYIYAAEIASEEAFARLLVHSNATQAVARRARVTWFGSEGLS